MVSCQAHNLNTWWIRAPLPLPLMKFYEDPVKLRRFHGWSTLIWLPFTMVSYVIGWLESVVFVSIVSMVALFLGSFSSWQAARTEVVQAENTESRLDKLDRLRRRRVRCRYKSKMLKKQIMRRYPVGAAVVAVNHLTSVSGGSTPSRRTRTR